MISRKTVVVVSGLAAGTLVAGLATAGATASQPAASLASVTATRLAPATALQPWPVLRQGPNSAWPAVTVRTLQYLLDAHGAKLTVDGVFGAQTRAAVIAYQRAHRVAVDGVVGPQTWGALLVTVKLGSTGLAVRAVQDQANFRISKYGYTLATDGLFGPVTQLWIRAFQFAGGLTPDGVVGPLTWQALVTESLTG